MKKTLGFILLIISIFMFSSCSVKINTPEVPKAFTQNAVVTSGDFSYECEICKKEGSVSITVKNTNALGLVMTYDGKNVSFKYSTYSYDISGENFEKENNNSRNTATKILCNKTYSGLSQQDDKDWWCFTAPKTGKYKFYCVEIKDNKYQTVKAYYGARLISATTMRSNQGWATLYRGTLKKGQKIYILLDNGSKNEFYRLKVKQIG